MNVSHVMTVQVVTLPPDASFKEVWKTIFKKKITSIPITDSAKRILGIITREDLLSRLYPDYKELFPISDKFPDFEEMEEMVKELSAHTAKSLMRKNVIYIHKDASIMRALSRMIVRRVNHLPVLENGKLVGMLTKGDIFYALFKKSIRS